MSLVVAQVLLLGTLTNNSKGAYMSETEFIQNLIDNQLGFGWYNGKFITNPTI